MEALLLVDIQNDYFPGGRMELCGALEAAGCAKALLESFRRRKLPVVHVRHVSTRPGASFFLPGTPGSEIHELAAPLEGERVVIKHFPNSFRDTGLDELLRGLGVSKLVVCGMMTHMCIDTTVRAAFDLGYEVALASDACATRDLKLDARTIPAADVQSAFLAALSPTFCKLASSASLAV